MLLQIQCPVCKQSFLIKQEQAGQQVQCPQGHTLAVQGIAGAAGPSPSKAGVPTVARTILEPTADGAAAPTAPAAEPLPVAPAPPRSTTKAAPATRKTSVPSQNVGQRKTGAPPARPAASSATRKAPPPTTRPWPCSTTP